MGQTEQHMYSIFTDHHTISFSTSLAIILLGGVLLLMKIPYAIEWRLLKQVRIYLSISYLILGVAGFFSSFVDYDSKTTMLPLELAITLVVGSSQALLFMMTNLVFIRSSYVNRRNVFLNLASIVGVGIVLFLVLAYLPKLFSSVFYIAIGGYACQLVYYYFLFRKEYRECVRRLEEHYDDDEEERLHWIRNCFYSALCIGILALMSVALPISLAVFDSFVLVYTLYYAYIVSTVYNYRSEALFLLQAIGNDFIAKQATDENQGEQPPLPPLPPVPIKELSKEDLMLKIALHNWVTTKRYLAADVSIDEIAVELHVSRNFLSSYFTTHKSTNFRKWRQSLRIQEAERIIKDESSVSVSSLHEMVGFTDRSNFYRQFTKLVGKTPAQCKAFYHQ